MTSAELISICANEAGDIGFEILTKQEYLQILNETLKEIAKEAGSFHEMDQVALIDGANTFSLTAQNVTKVTRLEYLINGSDDNLLPCHEIQFDVIQDKLRGTDGTLSYSSSPIGVQYYNNSGSLIMTITENALSEVVSDTSNWFASKMDNGLITLYFGFKFKLGDQIRYWYLSTWTNHNIYDNTNLIWDEYAPTVQEGMRWRIMRRVRFRGRVNSSKIQNWEYDKESDKSYLNYYKVLLPQLKKYTKQLKTSPDVLTMKPFKFL